MAAISGILLSAAVTATSFAGVSVATRLSMASQAVSSTSFDGSTKNVRLSMSSSVRATTSLAGSIKNVRLSMASVARSSSGFSATLARPITLSVIATASTSMSGTVTLAGKIASEAVSSSTMGASTRDDVLDVPRVIAEALSLWGFLCVKNAPAFAVNRALNDLNQSMQLVWNNARERAFWSRSTITVTITEDATTTTLGNDIQNVIGPCRRSDNKRPLVPVGSIGEIETFPDLFLDGETASEPVAYHVERTIQSGTEPAKCVLHVYPAPTGDDFELSIDVVKEAPRYNLVDVQRYTPLTIPHKYVETLLLPVLRYHASTFYLFQAKDMKETIDREYQQAKISLGLADPLPGKAGDNREERPS